MHEIGENSDSKTQRAVPQAAGLEIPTRLRMSLHDLWMTSVYRYVPDIHIMHSVPPFQNTPMILCMH